MIASCVGLLPAFAASWVKAALPEWFLPSHVVIKKQKEEGEAIILEELFDTELRVYHQLKPPQGAVVPTFYDSLKYDGVRAIMVEYLGGISLCSPEGATMTTEELSTLLQPWYRALNALGVFHDDPNLANVHFVDGKVMAMDFESAVFDVSPEDREYL